MLRKSEVNFVEKNKDNSGAMTAAAKQRMYRVRKKAQKTIEDMTYLAQNLPEKQLKQIFNETALIPFCKAILHRPEADKTHSRDHCAANSGGLGRQGVCSWDRS